MPSDIEKICSLLDEGAAELQCAAAMILGELRSKDAAVRLALVRALRSSNDTVRLYALEALSRIAPREALPHLIPLLGRADSLRGRAVQAIVQSGAEAADLLRQRMKTADASLRKGIVEVLGLLGGKETPDTLLQNLRDADPEVARQAAASLSLMAKRMSAAERKKIAAKVVSLLRAKKNESVIPALEVLAELGVPSSIRSLLAYTEKKHPLEVRSAALRALGRCGEVPDLFLRLLPLLSDPAWEAVVVPVLDLLEKQKLPAAATSKLLSLLTHPRSAVRVFALRALGKIGGKAAATSLIQSLWDAERDVAEAAAGVLKSAPAFAADVLRAFLAERESERSWKLVEILRARSEALDAKTAASLIRRLLVMVEKGEERFRYLLEVLGSVVPDRLRAAVLSKGRESLRKNDPAGAERFLRLVEREDLSTPETLYDLAVACWKVRRREEALAILTRLLAKGEPILARIEKDLKILGGGDLLSLGFRFVEASGPARDFGAQVLNLVARKFASSNEGRVAKNKLKTQGLR